MPSNRTLGIDPGYERLGVAVVEKNQEGKEVLVFSDCIRTSSKLPSAKRLAQISEDIEKVIEKYKPEHLSIETLFFNVNQKTVMLVAEARGVIISTASRKGLEVKEYSPLQIKVATTGFGRADKKQMVSMISRLIKLPKKKMLDDEYDAIAAALTHLACFRN